ncbi:Hypothetical predicted protein [Pelobates cultripes]|uniref:Uncharacterized protein n=1 Tax=Pelobates cultripes TaxID=61616 RepID=A0AAD1R1H5_PELCU|nr:Hypothetical predicted protein [Pelobates cultripes]
MAKDATKALQWTKQMFYEKSNKADTLLARRLRKRQQAKQITTIHTPTGQPTDIPNKIAETFQKYFTDLYDHSPQHRQDDGPLRDNIQTLLAKAHIPTLTTEAQAHLSTEITEEELTSTIEILQVSVVSTHPAGIHSHSGLDPPHLNVAVWEKLEALLQSPRPEPSHGGKLQGPTRNGKKGFDTPAPNRKCHATRHSLHNTHQAKGTPGTQLHRRPCRKVATQRGFKKGKSHPGSPRRWRTVKPNPAGIATPLPRTGSSQRPLQPAQISAGKLRCAPAPSMEAPLHCTPGPQRARLTHHSKYADKTSRTGIG